MKLITKISDFDYSNPEPIMFHATVLNVLSDGDGDKKPLKVQLKIEESGENVIGYSWKFENLETLKELTRTLDVYTFEGTTNVYKGENQLRLGLIHNANMISSKKILNNVDADAIKKEIISLMSLYIPSNSNYYKLIKTLVLDNEKFWKWPAATSVHHAYPGGLAKHTLNTCKNAIAIAGVYNGSNLKIDLIVAGAILHDIGKLDEYNADGTRTIYGKMISHPIIGYEKVVAAAMPLTNPYADVDLVSLEHIILSHHEKLEFGSPVVPSIAEAYIVARADAMDALFESADAALNNMEKNTLSEPLKGLDGNKIFKWHD